MRILIAENDPDVRSLLEKELAGWGYDVVGCVDGTQAWEILRREDTPRLAILDRSIAGMDGLQICRALRQIKKRPHIYLVLMISESRKVEVDLILEAGADEYLVKPVEIHELQARVRTGSLVVRLQQTFVSFLDYYESQAVTDPLTGLWNQETIAGILQRELARSKRQGDPIALLLTDLDQFKQIGDSSTDLTGDPVRREVARNIQSSVRSYDSVGLSGRKEMIIVAPGCNMESAKQLAERLRSSVGKYGAKIAGDAAHLTLSFGIIAAGGKKDWEANSLIKAAEHALHSAKSKGGNRIEVREEECVDQ